MKRVVPSVGIFLWLLCFSGSRALAQSGGTVGGVVRDLHGAPQMGALVELLSADATVVAHTFTDDRGRYALLSIVPGTYELRATTAFLRPALRTNLHLHAGVAAMANLTMVAMFEVGDWFPATRRGINDSADDWRWTLRSTANRPILRVDEDDQSAEPSLSDSQSPRGGSIVGQLSVQGHDGEFANGGLHQVLELERSQAAEETQTLVADVGAPTSSRTAPSIGLLTEYRRSSAFGGETRVVSGFASHPEVSGPGAEGLQAVSVAASEHFAVGNAVMIDAGTLLRAERLLKTRAQTTPFVRVVVSPEADLAVMYRFASGRELQSSEDLDTLQPISGILSNAEGEPLATKGTHQELSVAHKTITDVETLSVYQDDLPFEGIEGAGVLPSTDLTGMPVLSDGNTGTFRIAVHGYTSRGVSVSWTHTLTPALAACLKADVGSALVQADGSRTLANLDAALRTEIAPALSATIKGNVLRTGTNFSAQYRWQPAATLDEVNAFNATPDQAYLGFLLKQKLWSGHRLRGMDAILAATNLLEEGYRPVMGPDGRTLFLTQAGRTLQAGLSFHF